MRRALPAAAAVLALAGSWHRSGAEEGPGPTFEWSASGRVVAVGDIHGSYDELVLVIRGTELIGEDLSWTGGTDHLVVVGDFLDRGAGDRPIVDLLRRLETESVAAGGRVHVVLGNHEVLNLVRDLRYVSPKGYADFAEDESTEQRQAESKRFLRRRKGERRLEAEKQFEQRYPPGYFARLEMFDPDGEYGSWLLDLPVVIKVNGVVYVHGGLTEEVAALGLAAINQQIRKELVAHLEARHLLQQKGLITSLMDFGEIQDVASRVASRRSMSSVRQAAGTLLELANSPLFRETGPLWYRGNSLENERVERARISGALELLGATAMVVAHSPTTSRDITSRFSQRLYRVDHGVFWGTQPQALVWSGGQALVFNSSTKTLSQPRTELPQGEGWVTKTGPLSDAQIEEFLTGSKVVDSRDLGRGSTRPRLLELRDGDLRMRGVFKDVELPPGPATNSPGEPADRYQHEVAAYLLDRELGLKMVPVTAVRRVKGRNGSLQCWVEEAVDQESIDADPNLQPTHPEKVRDQLARARIFDALIGNRGRKPTDILYLLDESRVLLIDHSRAFSLSTEIGSIDGVDPLSFDPGLRQALAELDQQWLRSQLGDLLTVPQIDALLTRRDRILQRFAQAQGTFDSGH